MSIETAITHAWQRQAPWLWLLLPLSGLYGLITALRRRAYSLGVLPAYRAPVPVMVIGNITVGGSGKTPLIISLVHYLQDKGVSVGVISRGYGGNSQNMPMLVTPNSFPSEVGDEPCLIVTMTAVPMAVCPNRQHAIETLLRAHPDLQLIIADDGLQHYALQRDIEWIVVDVARGFGNEQRLPTGFLREPLSRLKNATVVYHDTLENLVKYSHKEHHLSMHLQPTTLQALWQPQSVIMPLERSKPEPPTSGMTVHAVSGIGYPQRFFMTLQALGFQVIAHPYPDHHQFALPELLPYQQYPIIITSKDAVKIQALFRQQPLDAPSNELLSRLWVLPVTATLSAACHQTLQQQLRIFNINI